MIISVTCITVHATFWLGTEQCSNRRRNLVPDESGDMHDTRTRNRRQKNGVDLHRSLFIRNTD